MSARQQLETSQLHEEVCSIRANLKSLFAQREQMGFAWEVHCGREVDVLIDAYFQIIRAELSACTN